MGSGSTGIYVALRATARLAFLMFWPAYVGSALVFLFGRAFQPLQRRARELSLGFAAVQTVHFGLVGWLCLIGATPSVKTFAFFGIGAVWLYLLALFSIGSLQQRLGPKRWRALCLVGMNYIALAFAVDFLRHPSVDGLTRAILYWPFAALAVAGPILIACAAIRRSFVPQRRSPWPSRRLHEDVSRR
jgi:hypothetical protein